MAVTWKINGVTLTQKEYDAHCKKNAKRYADNMSDILSARKPPGLAGDDDSYLKEAGPLEKQFGSRQDYEMRMAELAAKGVKPPSRAVYEPSIARFPNDPRAYVTSRAEAKKYLEEQGAESHGWFETKRREPTRDPKELKVALADDLAAEMIRKETAKDPSLKKKKPRELKEMVTEKYGTKGKGMFL